MNISNIPKMVIGLVVAILIVTVVAIPIISDLQDQSMTVINENVGARYMLRSDSATSDITIAYNGTTTKGLTINGEIVPLPDDSNKWNRTGVALWNERLYVSAGVSNTVDDTLWEYWQADGPVTSAINQDWTIEIKGNTFTFTNHTKETSNTGTLTGDTWIYNKNGDYGSFEVKSNSPLFVNPDSMFVCLRCGVHWGTTAMFGPTTYSETITGKLWAIPSGTPAEPTDVTLTLTGVSLDDGSIEITGASFASGDTATNLTTFLAPLKYTTTEDTPVSQIIGIIPILLVVSLLIGVVGAALVVNRR